MLFRSSSAKDFDVRKNQPDFIEMVNNRMKEAKEVDGAIENYKRIYDYSDYDIEQLDPDLFARDIMNIVNSQLNKDSSIEDQYSELNDTREGISEESKALRAKAVENTEVTEVTHDMEEKKRAWDTNLLYADGYLAKGDLVTYYSGQINQQYEAEIVRSFVENLGSFQQDSSNFSYRNGKLYSSDGNMVYFEKINLDDFKKDMTKASKDPNSRVYDEGNMEDDFKNDPNIIDNYRVTSHFYKFLVNRDNWDDFANGHFEETMGRLMREKM